MTPIFSSRALRPLALASLVGLAVGVWSGVVSVDRGAAARPGALQPRSLDIDTRDQYALARQLDAADRADDPERAYAELLRAWQGRRYRWRIYRIAALCHVADACHVLPFDRAGKDGRIVHGWMPRLDLDAAQLARIDAECAGQARCELTIEGTLSELVLSIDRPTSLTFSDVTAIRAPR